MAGMVAMLATVGRLYLSPGATGLGPSLTFGFGSNLLKSYGSSSNFRASDVLDRSGALARSTDRSGVSLVNGSAL